MKTKKCGICKSGKVEMHGWIYEWYGKQFEGVCEKCKQMWYHLAYIALAEAEKDIKKAGMKIIQSKDKFGSLRIYTDLYKEDVLKKLEIKYKKKYPMFNFYFG